MYVYTCIYVLANFVALTLQSTYARVQDCVCVCVCVCVFKSFSVCVLCIVCVCFRFSQSWREPLLQRSPLQEPCRPDPQCPRGPPAVPLSLQPAPRHREEHCQCQWAALLSYSGEQYLSYGDKFLKFFLFSQIDLEPRKWNLEKFSIISCWLVITYPVMHLSVFNDYTL